MTPEEVNGISDDALSARLDALIEALHDGNPFNHPPLVPFVTHLLVHRANHRILELHKKGVDCCLPRLKLLAHVVTSMTGFSLPSHPSDVEKWGDRLDKVARRFVEQRRKVEKSRSKEKAETLANLEAKLAIGPWGSMVSFEDESPIGHLAELPPTIPRLRDSTVGRWHIDAEEEIKVMQNKIALLRADADAVRYESRRREQAEYQAREAEAHAALVRMSAVVARKEASSERATRQMVSAQLEERELALEESRQMLVDVKAELHSTTCKLEESSVETSEAHKLLEQAQEQREAITFKLSAAREEVKKVREHNVKLEGRVIRLGAQITKKMAEAAAELKKRERMEKQLERVLKERLRKELPRIIGEVETAFEARLSRLARLKCAQANKRRAAEARALTSEKRLERAQLAEAECEELRVQVDELQQELEDLKGQQHSETSGCAQVSRRDDRGRFKADDWRLRPMEWAELARRTPPGAIGANLRDVLRVYAPDVSYSEPTERQLRARRIELTIAGECIANFRVGKSIRIISFGLDESTKYGQGLLSTNTQIERHDAPGTSVDVVQRGCTLTAGADAESIAKSINTNIFAHGRKLLCGWKAVHEGKFGEGSWGADGAPEPDSLGMHRLSENTVIMGDTCSTAEKTKRLVAEAAEASGKEQIGEAQWQRMSESERAAACKAHIGRCHQHLRNIVINAMQLRQAASLKEQLTDDLAEFSSFDRMSVDVNDLIRGAYKEMHAGGAYAKGKGREFEAYRKKHHAHALFLPFERAEGSRQDLAFDGSLPIFANRKMILEFLHGLDVPGANNILEQFLRRVLSCNEVTAALRVNTLWKYIFSEPTRWLAGKGGELGWGLDDSSQMVDNVEKLMVEVAADGRKLLDPNFDPFKLLAQKLPPFKEWREQHMQRRQWSPDGTRYATHQLVLDEARNPEGMGNKQATECVVSLAKEMANAALAAMRDPRRAITDLLTSQDGKFSAGKDPRRNEATKKTHHTNDRVESNFGGVDLLMRMFRYTTVEGISGMAQQMRNHDFDTPPNIISDRRKRKHEQQQHHGGFFYTGLCARLQESLVEYARHTAAEARVEGRQALEAQAAEKLERREERVTMLLHKAVEQYAYSKELFESWLTQRASSKASVKKALLHPDGKSKPEAQQLEYLRHQIEMRTLGCGWTQFSTRWSSAADSRIGTVAHLQTLLEEIIDEEMSLSRLKQLPTETAPPQHSRGDVAKLGTLDADALEVSSRALFSAEELSMKAEQAMTRRIESGIADEVERLQPPVPPPFDQGLVGKRLEVLWKYFEKDTDRPHMIWVTGRVVRVADGLQDKRSKRARTVLPAGAVLWAWDEDPTFGEQAGEQWLFLLPKKWNPSTHTQVYSWRYDPRELGLAHATAPADSARAKTLRRANTNEM